MQHIYIFKKNVCIDGEAVWDVHDLYLTRITQPSVLDQGCRWDVRTLTSLRTSSSERDKIIGSLLRFSQFPLSHKRGHIKFTYFGFWI